MSTTKNKKTHLFVDMDGTLAVWKQAACFEDLLQPGYFRDLPPYQTVLDAVKILCNTKPELDVYALSAFMPENPYAVSEKNAWLYAQACLVLRKGAGQSRPPNRTHSQGLQLFAL